jgi:membrane protein required for colicin V production
MTISYFDIFAGGILVYALIRGAINGFVMELSSTVAFLLGILGAVLFGGWVESYLREWVQWPYLGVMAFILVFCIVLVLTYLLGNTITRLIEMTPLNVFNRLLGALFSLVKYAFLISVLISVFNFFNAKGDIGNEPGIDNSYLYPYLQYPAPALYPYLQFSDKMALWNGQ